MASGGAAYLSGGAYDTLVQALRRTMPAVKIAPSVLASDLGNLTYECKRMIQCGADWLHMGTYTEVGS